MAVSQLFFCPTGTTIQIDEIGATFADIANVFTGRLKAIQLPPLEGEEVEVTHGGTTAESSGKIIRRFEGGCLIQFGDGSVVIYMNKNTAYQPMIGKSYNFKVTFPLLSGESTAVEWAFEAVLKRYAPGNFDLLANGKAEATWTFKVSGPITETAAT
jgi:hypothetical protein